MIRASLISIKSTNCVGSVITSLVWKSKEQVIYRAKKPSVGPCRGSEDEDVGRILLEMLEENIKEICK